VPAPQDQSGNPAGGDSPAEIKIGAAVDFPSAQRLLRRKNDELRFLERTGNESSETNHRKQAEKVMPQYLVANYVPDDFDPSVVTEAMIAEIHALNREVIAAGVR
jgi:hypothetical protein